MIQVYDITPGMWYHTGDFKPFYVGSIIHTEVALFRRDISGAITDESKTSEYTVLEGVKLATNHLDQMKFKSRIPEQSDGETIYEFNVMRNGTTLAIKIDSSGGRYTTYLTKGDNKIYLHEVSFVHEVQRLILTLTGSLPKINII